MASFPSAIKSFTNPTGSDNQNLPPHAQQHIDANGEIVAIETELGLLPKGTYTSVVVRLNDAVYKTTDQAVAGVKTFASTPVIPVTAPTLTTQVANKKYVDDSVATISTVPQNIQVFTSSGTWTKPATISRVYVRVWGGGGNGTEATSGSGGGYSEGIIAVTANVTITVGAGGSADTANGNNGGTSSFVGTTTIQATGGNGGTTGGGVGSGGSLNFTGGDGNGTSGGGSPMGAPPRKANTGLSPGGGGGFKTGGASGGDGLVMVMY